MASPGFCGAICVRTETFRVSTVCMALWSLHGWFYKHYEFPIPGTENILSMHGLANLYEVPLPKYGGDGKGLQALFVFIH